MIPWQKIIAVLVLSLATMSAHGGQPTEPKPSRERSQIENALTAAIDWMGQDEAVALENRRTFITPARGYLVVSFWVMGDRVKGGRTHLVYDPRLDKIVYVEGEQ